MKKHLHKFETTMWLFIKLLLCVTLMLSFTRILGQENIGLTRLSRMLGITVSTFVVLWYLFLSAYGRYDVGRRKSKPIIYSLSLAVFCTDVITYLQVMIMRTNSGVHEFRLRRPDLLLCTFIVQVIVIVVFTYGGNWLFFKIHKPEKCCVITSSQKRLDEIAFAIGRFKKQYEITKVLDYHSKNLKEHIHKPEKCCVITSSQKRLDEIAFAIGRFKKQYEITKVLDYHSKNLKEHIKHADTVFMYDVPVEARTEIMRMCYKYKVNVYFNPEIEDIMELNATHYILDDMYLFNKNVKTLTMEQRIMKRLLDIILSLILGVLSAPFWIGGMIAVKLYDGGPVLFKQERATINGKRFQVYKLRTMKQGVSNYSVKKDDDRITKPGRFLRRTRIDELPQLLNVLKGDMTFVGPRPEMIKNVDAYTEELPEFKYRLRMKAGLTGYAQIAGKYNTTPKDKLIMDMMYIEQFSILRDIQLILQTIVVLFKSDSTEAFDKNSKKTELVFEKEEE